jgi:RNA polymerase sigma-B factor
MTVTGNELERQRRTEAAVAELALCLAESADARDSERESRARDELVLANTGVAEAIARRYGNRGEPVEELTQTAYLGLVKAAQGFAPDRASDFLAYAVPTIAGEIKRHFRDQGWAIRPPRRIQELGLRMKQARAELEGRLGRAITAAELAAELGVDEEQVIEALVSDQGWNAVSLDAPVGGAQDGNEVTVADGLSQVETGFEKVDDLVSLRPLLDRLPPRERRILALRYFEELTQQQIGERVGVTQMQVSRLLTQTLTRLREDMAAAS